MVTNPWEMGKEKVTPLKSEKENDIDSKDEKTKNEPPSTPAVGLCELVT